MNASYLTDAAEADQAWFAARPNRRYRIRRLFPCETATIGKFGNSVLVEWIQQKKTLCIPFPGIPMDYPITHLDNDADLSELAEMIYRQYSFLHDVRKQCVDFVVSGKT